MGGAYHEVIYVDDVAEAVSKFSKRLKIKRRFTREEIREFIKEDFGSFNHKDYKVNKVNNLNNHSPIEPEGSLGASNTEVGSSIPIPSEDTSQDVCECGYRKDDHEEYNNGSWEWNACNKFKPAQEKRGCGGENG